MRHRIKRNKIGRSASHRKALLRNMATSLFLYGRIETTITKAKFLRSYAEKLVTKAKAINCTNNLSERNHNIRLINSEIRDKSAIQSLIRIWGVHCLYRNGGYTRILKTYTRLGDGTQMAIISLVFDDEILKRYNYNGYGFKKVYSFLYEHLILDIPLPKELIDFWKEFIIPKFSINWVVNKRSVVINIEIDKIDFKRNKWPIYNGVYPYFPITMHIKVFPNFNLSYKYSLSKELVEMPVFRETNQLRYLCKANERVQTIECEMSTRSRRANLENLQKCELLMLGPRNRIYNRVIDFS